MKRLQFVAERDEAAGYGVEFDLFQTHSTVLVPVQHVVIPVDSNDASLCVREREN